jgi:Bacterial lectin
VDQVDADLGPSAGTAFSLLSHPFRREFCMRNARTLLALILALAAGTVGHAATLVATDFSQGAAGWHLNGKAKLASINGDSRAQVLSLTQNAGNQRATAWSEMSFKIPSFSFIADVRIRFEPGGIGDCPADGVALAFAPVPADALGGGGGNLGLFASPGTISTVTAFEINTWSGQGLGDQERNDCVFGKNETFAIDVVRPDVPNKDDSRFNRGGTPEKGGFKIGQVLPPQGMAIVNAGFYRYQWNVAENGDMTVYVSGLDDFNRPFQKVKVLEVQGIKDAINFEGRFGLAAGTGGLMQHAEVAAVRIDSPMVEPQ